MIEVIEERPKRKCECTRCNSRLSYGEEDIIKAFGQPSYIAGHIVCPVCGETLYITKKIFNLFGDAGYSTDKDLKEFFK